MRIVFARSFTPKGFEVRDDSNITDDSDKTLRQKAIELMNLSRVPFFAGGWTKSAVILSEAKDLTIAVANHAHGHACKLVSR